ncbi:DUF922 domain-containing protein [Peijinzhouia sedimentorum]
MKLLLFVYIQSLILLNSNICQSTEMIFWREDLELSWSDFKGEPQLESQYEAMTASGIEYAYEANNRNGKLTFTFKVRAYFNPNTSWLKPSSRTNELLEHEQVHFDISELHARILTKAFDEASFTENFKKEIDTIYQSVIKRRAEMQELYDKETDHSRNAERQKEWIKQVENQLASFR